MAEQKEVNTLKMAKASKEEWEALLDFFQNLEEMVEQDPWNSEIGEYVVDKMHGDVGAAYNRVLWGFVTLVTNVCDPELTYLELKPELRNLVAERDAARRLARKLYKRNKFLEEMNEAALDTGNRLLAAGRYAMQKHGQLAARLDEETDRKLHAMDLTDRALAMSDRALSMAARVIVERDGARSERDEARAVARRYYRRASDLYEALVTAERILNHAWRTVDAICGANHGEPLPIDSLPKDRQGLVYELVGLLAEHGGKIEAALAKARGEQ